MGSQHADLKELGWTDWFEQRAECRSSEMVARVAAVDREQLVLMNQTGLFRAKLAGGYLYRHPLSQELPCVGDWVCVEKQRGDDVGLVHSLLERRTALRRKSAGDAIEYQMIAANVDFVFIVQSCHFDFNLNRLERYLVIVRDGGAEPYVLLTKTDLVSAEVLSSQLSEIRSAGVTAPIMTLSNVTQEGVEELRGLLLPGKTYCFVGSSGVGKSTLINLLLRLYEPDEGRILIDGRDIREMGLSLLRRQIGLVPQDTYLFSGSVWDNIRYGNPSATREELIRCAELANANDFILDLPEGYDTKIGERGVRLSGGQRQRLSIAMAFAKAAPILVLDEATASMDSISETAIQVAMDRLMEKRTTFIIAHRLGTVRHADCIVVLDKGQIVEQGDHDTLIRGVGVYSELYSQHLVA